MALTAQQKAEKALYDKYINLVDMSPERITLEINGEDKPVNEFIEMAELLFRSVSEMNITPEPSPQDIRIISMQRIALDEMLSTLDNKVDVVINCTDTLGR